MSVRLNVHITKIMRTLTKVGVHTYATYANCRTLNKLYKTLGYGSRDMLKSDFLESGWEWFLHHILCRVFMKKVSHVIF